jgi:fatty acid desaturase
MGVRAYPPSFYVRQVKPRLAAALSTPAPSRLLWLPVHAAVIVAATLAIAREAVPWPVVPVLSLLIGLAFGGLMFLGHETLHGAVLRGRWAWAKTPVGMLCFAPLVLSPRLWSVWHNRVHHANANRLGIDPDMYPSLDAYRASLVARIATDHFALGGRRWRGLLCLVIGFSGQSLQMIVSARSRLQMSARDHRRALIEAALPAGLWLALALALGPVPFVLAYVLPLVVANVVVMSFIVTNHGLSPATDVNDPLLGSLSVTVPRWLEWLTLDFGYHVEHHLFPAASTRHGRAIRAELVATWPDRYQSMPLVTALARLFRTGRVYRDAATLADPRSGGAWPALGPPADGS